MSYPYISITDFETAEQILAMRKVLDGTGSNRKLGAGVMMSYKTLHGIESSWTKFWPPKEALSDIFTDNGWSIINTLHYADYDDNTTIEDLARVVEYGGPHLDALQLDMIWPNSDMLKQLCWNNESKESLDIILQVGSIAMDRLNNEPYTVAAVLADYYRKDCIDYVLLDPSGGRGIPLQASQLLPYVEEIERALPNLEIVIAGGLGPTTTHLAKPVVEHNPFVSLCAQGQLRSSGDAHDPIEWDRAATYLEQAAALFN